MLIKFLSIWNELLWKKLEKFIKNTTLYFITRILKPIFLKILQNTYISNGDRVNFFILVVYPSKICRIWTILCMHGDMICPIVHTKYGLDSTEPWWVNTGITDKKVENYYVFFENFNIFFGPVQIVALVISVLPDLTIYFKDSKSD